MRRKSKSSGPVYVFVLLLSIVSAFAGVTRFTALERSPFRADELNMYRAVEQGYSVLELWRNPPWMNQIPAAETLAIGSSSLFDFESREKTTRFPFALFGVLTVLLCGRWMVNQYGLAAGLLLVIWMGLNPFHLYESREAYYYVLLMFFSAGSVFACVSLSRSLKEERIPLRSWLIWLAWLALACHMHMSFWVFAAVQWIFVLYSGMRSTTGEARRTHLLRTGMVALVMAVLMSRWVWRAVQEVLTAEERGGHIGDPLEWVLPRLIPMFLAGANWVGWLLVGVLVVAAIVAFKSLWREDTGFRALTLLMVAGFGAALLYVGLLGGGVAKFTYFSAYWPLLLIWSTVLIVRAASILDARRPKTGALALGVFAIFLIGTMAAPAWQIMQLDGKPTPYKVLQAELDRLLPPGTVVVVDRWFEPWNEMAVHAPTNVFVTFTVPDEPYDAYIQNRWRDVTRHYFERDRGQAFLMLTRNHWEREGVWSWPRQHFARHATIANESGLWLRERGFAPVGEFYDAQTNRLVINLFYDLPEDRLARARAGGATAWAAFDRGWDYFKPWRPPAGWSEQQLQLLWIQAGRFQEQGQLVRHLDQFGQFSQQDMMRWFEQGRWVDYRIATPHAELLVVQDDPSAEETTLELVGMALQGAARLRVGGQTITFPPDRLSRQSVRIAVEPGKQSVPVRPLNAVPLLVYSVRVAD